MESFAFAAPSRRSSYLLIPAFLILSGCGADDGAPAVRAEASSSSVHPINANLATRAELASVSGIGDALAAQIVDTRERTHLFAEPADLANVVGIGAASVQPLLRSLVTKVDLDGATEAEIESLPMIGQAKAVAIVEWRNQHGSFASVDDLAKVPGIDATTVETVRPYVKALHVAPNPGSEAVDVNDADLDTLEALPGLGFAKAQAIIDYRLAHGPFTRIDDLSSVPGIGPDTLAELEPLLWLGPSDFEDATFAVEGTWSDVDPVGGGSSARFAKESTLITLDHGRLTLNGACASDDCPASDLRYAVTSRAANGDFAFRLSGWITIASARARVIRSTGTVTAGTISLDVSAENVERTRTISVTGYRVLN